MNDIERASTSTANPYSIGLSSSSRRPQSGLAFSTEASGLVDVFAQVFAQMSALVVEAGANDTTVDQAKSLIDSSSSSETKDDDRDVISEDAKEPSDSVREAFLQSLASVNQQTQVQPEDKGVVEEAVSQIAVEVEEAVSQTAVEVDHASATNLETAGHPVEEEAQATDLGVESSVNSSIDLAGDSRKSSRDTSTTVSTEAVAVETPDVSPDAQATEADKSDGAETAAESESFDSSLTSQADSSEDRASRRSSRRNHQGRDRSHGVEQSNIEAAAEKPVDAPQTQASSVETPTSTTALEPQSSEPAPSAVVAATPKSSVAPASAVAGVAAAQGAAAARAVTSTASASTGSSSNDATAVIQSAGPATNARSNATEKTSAANGNSADDAVTRAKLVQRVSRAFQHFGAEGGSIRLRLAPAELGSVRVEMQIQGGKVNARVVAETEAASTILRDHLADLRSRLESQGMQVESFEIETDENSFSSSQDPYGQNARDSYQERSQDERFLPEQRVAKLPVSRDVSYAVDLHDPVLLTAGVDAKF